MNLSSIIDRIASITMPGRPMVLYHKPTARCDCRCRFCDSWVGQPKEDDVLPTEVILSALERSRSAGMTVYTLWGGEPLAAYDLPAWLKKAKQLGMETVMCTSGSRLSKRAAEIGPHLDRLLLSMEATGDELDRMRGTPGLYEAVVEGVKRFKEKSGGEITIWSNISRDNADQVLGLARFARGRGIFIEFFPAAVYPGYNEKMVLDKKEREEVFGLVRELKMKGYPIKNTWYALDIMASSRRFKCNMPRIALQLFPGGELYSCEPRLIEGLEPHGDVRDVDISDLIESGRYREVCEGLSDCNRCLLPCVANMADGLVAQAVRRAVNESFYKVLQLVSGSR